MTGPRDDKPESDVEPEDHETRSRAGKGADDGTSGETGAGEDGTYVGATGPDDALDVGETGAEARSQRG